MRAYYARIEVAAIFGFVLSALMAVTAFLLGCTVWFAALLGGLMGVLCSMPFIFMMGEDA